MPGGGTPARRQHARRAASDSERGPSATGLRSLRSRLCDCAQRGPAYLREGPGHLTNLGPPSLALDAPARAHMGAGDRVCPRDCAALLRAAYSGGITGYSGKSGASVTCNQCHSGGPCRGVAITGPRRWEPAINTFRITVTSLSVSPRRAPGSTSPPASGTLNVVTTTDSEIRQRADPQGHQGRIRMAVAFWDFTWQAPAAAGTYTIYGAGNSVNRNNAATGDRAAARTLSWLEWWPRALRRRRPPHRATRRRAHRHADGDLPVGQPTATPLAHRHPDAATEPDPPATQTATMTPTPGLCPGDCDGDDL